MSSNLLSSGRGGAGNIVDSSKTSQIQPKDLQTPTLKTNAMVTTGRGGTGNMAANLDAEEKRRRQDVEPVVRRESHGAAHFGRGGTGNVAKSGSGGEDEKNALARVRSAAEKERQEKGKGKEKEDSEAVVDDDRPAAADSRKSEEPSPSWAEKGRNLLFGKK